MLQDLKMICGTNVTKGIVMMMGLLISNLIILLRGGLLLKLEQLAQSDWVWGVKEEGRGKLCIYGS